MTFCFLSRFCILHKALEVDPTYIKGIASRSVAVQVARNKILTQIDPFPTMNIETCGQSVNTTRY